ncbi:hypothetical protein E4U21_003962 [Claviceps maximensis]|nr:hypothetical protein E4U21_003962 [Claviceps maximensis]
MPGAYVTALRDTPSPRFFRLPDSRGPALISSVATSKTVLPDYGYKYRTLLNQSQGSYTLLPISSHAIASQPMKYAAPLVQARGYAATRRKLDGVLSLDHFLQRSRVLAFYRTILRGTRTIRDAQTRTETRRFARDEFERRRHVTDINHIRYLLSTGKTEWESMERYIGGM